MVVVGGVRICGVCRHTFRYCVPFLGKNEGLALFYR